MLPSFTPFVDAHLDKRAKRRNFSHFLKDHVSEMHEHRIKDTIKLSNEVLDLKERTLNKHTFNKCNACNTLKSIKSISQVNDRDAKTE